MIQIGMRVLISSRQKILGNPRFPGRIGTVVELNPYSINIDGTLQNSGLWYVELESTGIAKAQKECFWGEELILIPEDAA